MTSSSSSPVPQVRDTDCRPHPLSDDLRVAVTRAVRRLRLERSNDCITDGQYAVLAELANRGPMTPTALAEHERVAGPPMTRTINALVDGGLAQRDSHPTDRRQVLVSITEAGMAEVAETRRRRNVWLSGWLCELTPDEREVLAQAAVLLERMVVR